MGLPGPRTTCRYSREFKATAARLSQLDGVEVCDVAQSLCMHPFMLSKWRRQVREALRVAGGLGGHRGVALILAIERRRVARGNRSPSPQGNRVRK